MNTITPKQRQQLDLAFDALTSEGVEPNGVALQKRASVRKQTALDYLREREAAAQQATGDLPVPDDPQVADALLSLVWSHLSTAAREAVAFEVTDLRERCATREAEAMQAIDDARDAQQAADARVAEVTEQAAQEVAQAQQEAQDAREALQAAQAAQQAAEARAAADHDARVRAEAQAEQATALLTAELAQLRAMLERETTSTDEPEGKGTTKE